MYVFYLNSTQIFSVTGWCLINGEGAIFIARTFMGRRKNFTGQVFWARGCYVLTVGRDAVTVRNYIRHQEEESKRIEWLNLS